MEWMANTAAPSSDVLPTPPVLSNRYWEQSRSYLPAECDQCDLVALQESRASDSEDIVPSSHASALPLGRVATPMVGTRAPWLPRARNL